MLGNPGLVCVESWAVTVGRVAGTPGDDILFPHRVGRARLLAGLRLRVGNDRRVRLGACIRCAARAAGGRNDRIGEHLILAGGRIDLSHYSKFPRRGKTFRFAVKNPMPAVKIFGYLACKKHNTAASTFWKPEGLPAAVAGVGATATGAGA